MDITMTHTDRIKALEKYVIDQEAVIKDLRQFQDDNKKLLKSYTVLENFWNTHMKEHDALDIKLKGMNEEIESLGYLPLTDFTQEIEELQEEVKGLSIEEGYTQTRLSNLGEFVGEFEHHLNEGDITIEDTVDFIIEFIGCLDADGLEIHTLVNYIAEVIRKKNGIE